MTHLNSLLAKKVILIKDTFPSKEIRLHQQIIVGTESYGISKNTLDDVLLRICTLYIIYVPCNNSISCCTFVACLHCCLDRYYNIFMVVKIFPHGNLTGWNTKIMPQRQYIIFTYFTSHLNYRIFLFIQTSNNFLYRSCYRL